MSRRRPLRYLSTPDRTPEDEAQEVELSVLAELALLGSLSRGVDADQSKHEGRIPGWWIHEPNQPYQSRPRPHRLVSQRQYLEWGEYEEWQRAIEQLRKVQAVEEAKLQKWMRQWDLSPANPWDEVP